ncbi:hypothetical protein BpHYR1_030318 [Brachionus plicatilis]|uniref:Uncharacterized protein n=1 Tax=Brachionus plicatilis TaxID=10195 RepID=A0A3M7RR72_BRAPC|nr:hypothetical protein BpHYR1_030318 [Brachionus plicatilis]
MWQNSLMLIKVIQESFLSNFKPQNNYSAGNWFVTSCHLISNLTDNSSYQLISEINHAISEYIQTVICSKKKSFEIKKVIEKD